MKKKISFDKKSLTNLLTSKFVLNVVFIISFFSFISHIMTGKLHIVVLFILVALLTSHFSKNMIIVLLVPLLLVNFYSSFVDRHITEGMENNDSSSTNIEKVKTAEAIKAAKPSTPAPTTPEKPVEAKPSKKNEESFDVPNKKNKYNIDYASTVEEAYDNLNNILGGDNIKKLSKDTEGLVNQQLQLAEAMKNIEPLIGTMGPLLKQAEGLLGTMGGGNNITKIMQSLNLNDKSK